MIEIDAENKKIFFYYSPKELKQKERRDETMYEFSLLSGHVCPECNKVLDAYYVGTLPIGGSSGTYSSHPYVPNPNGGYDRFNPRYKFGHKHGGGYLIMCNHNDICAVHTASVGGIVEGIESIIDPKIEIKPTNDMIKKFAENNIPGMSLIKDPANKRAPILAINKKIFASKIEVKGWSEFDKQYKWIELFTKLVMENPEVAIIE